LSAYFDLLIASCNAHIAPTARSWTRALARKERTWLTSRWIAPRSICAPSSHQHRSCAGPSSPWRASITVPCAPRPCYPDEVVGLVRRTTDLESVVGLLGGPRRRIDAWVLDSSRARAASRACPPPWGCALTKRCSCRALQALRLSAWMPILSSSCGALG